MCGLVGVFGNLTWQEEEAFKDMLTMDIVRGPHSTGVAAISFDNKLTIVKGLACPPKFFREKEWTKINKNVNNCLIGHNRFATTGKVTKENAHPFHFKPIVGVHNGTIRDKWRLPDNTEFDTDSENLYYSIALNGLEETWKMTNGAAALVWYDLEDEKLNILKNKERPLYWRYTKDRDILFWASEKWMISAACERNNIPLETDTYFPENNTQYSFKFLNGSIVEEAKSIVPFSYIVENQHYYSNYLTKNEKNKKGKIERTGFGREGKVIGDRWEFEGKIYTISNLGNLIFCGRVSDDPAFDVDYPLDSTIGFISKEEKELNKELDNVKFLQDAGGFNEDRKTKKLNKKIQKSLRKRKAIERRKTRSNNTTKIDENSEKEIEWWSKYGYFCINDPKHLLDPSTAHTVTTDSALCEECYDDAKNYGISPFGLRGA